MIERHSAKRFLTELRDMLRRFLHDYSVTGALGLTLDDMLQRSKSRGFFIGQELLSRKQGRNANGVQ
jgi:hypothetical protein